MPHLINTAKKNLAKFQDKIGEYYQIGMEKFEFTHKYDLIWFQWVIGHLTDYDMVKFLKKSAENLTPEVFYQ